MHTAQHLPLLPTNPGGHTTERNSNLMDIAGRKRLSNKEKEIRAGTVGTTTITAKEEKVVGMPHRHL